MTIITREVILRSRPVGKASADDFEFRTRELPDPRPGEVVIRNHWMSVDPYMRRKMNAAVSYTPPYKLGQPLTGAAVGEVVASADATREVGDLVVHNAGWCTYAVCDAERTLPIDVDVAPPSAYLGVLGMPGMTAYVGLLHIADLQEADTVFVSAAAGAVGSLVGQIAKLRGNHVIGSAGSADKVAWLRDELGFDEVINYRDGDVTELLAAAAPDGIDVYFDNVGYDHLAAALNSANDGARFAMCGTVTDYDSIEALPGPSNLFQIVGKRLTLKGFIVSDHMEFRPRFLAEVGRWVSDGSIIWRETVVDGLDAAPGALLGLFEGSNVGKMLVRLEGATPK